MARLYSRKKGRSGSTKPSKPQAKAWVRYKPKEIEMLILKLGKEGNTASKIGLILRDTYGIPSVKDITKKSISKILEEKKLSPKIPDDLMALMKKAVQLRKHMEANKHDMPGLRGLQLTESKIKRLVKYYKDREVLESSWKYDPESIKLLIG